MCQSTPNKSGMFTNCVRLRAKSNILSATASCWRGLRVEAEATSLTGNNRSRDTIYQFTGDSVRLCSQPNVALCLVSFFCIQLACFIRMLLFDFVL